ncbi:hypothetical protein LIER_41816 [Lithospermum erythrorhizon]|uniref:RNA-directed RNA polymerase n=1 Tax=Lithospermum erythrorhizon TaxID=34254 RepID=A0AAV3RGT7_LITER
MNEKIFYGCLDSTLLLQADELTKEYHMLYSAERQLFQSKAKMRWYRDGDANTSLFHKRMRLHQAKNRITQIHDDSGVLVKDYDRVKEVVVNFYKDLFTAPTRNIV